MALALDNCFLCNKPFQRTGAHKICSECSEREQKIYFETFERLKGVFNQLDLTVLGHELRMNPEALEEILSYSLGYHSFPENEIYKKGHCYLCSKRLLNCDTKDPICMQCLSAIDQYITQYAIPELKPLPGGDSSKATENNAINPINETHILDSMLSDASHGATTEIPSASPPERNSVLRECCICGKNRERQENAIDSHAIAPLHEGWACYRCYNRLVELLKQRQETPIAQHASHTEYEHASPEHSFITENPLKTTMTTLDMVSVSEDYNAAIRHYGFKRLKSR